MKIAVIGKGKQAAHTAAAFALCKDCQVFFYNTSEGVSRTVEGRTEDVLLDRVGRGNAFPWKRPRRRSQDW